MIGPQRLAAFVELAEEVVHRLKTSRAQPVPAVGMTAGLADEEELGSPLLRRLGQLGKVEAGQVTDEIGIFGHCINQTFVIRKSEINLVR